MYISHSHILSSSRLPLLLPQQQNKNSNLSSQCKAAQDTLPQATDTFESRHLQFRQPLELCGRDTESQPTTRKARPTKKKKEKNAKQNEQ